MASGNKVMITNTRERVLSTDQNRAQRFIGTHMAETLRYMLDAQSEFDQQAGGVASVGTTTDNPLRAVIMNGILPTIPDALGVDMTISAGVLGVVDPDTIPNPDDSPFKWIVDPGVTTLGTLTLTANSSGSTRIDVVECSRVTSVLESDNRDVFDPATGLFTPTLLDKVEAGRLTYRIRTGTAGAGFPGTASGWLPLAVLSVPTGTTTWNTVNLWDVRPLAQDFAFAPFNVSRTQEITNEANLVIDNTGASQYIEGTFEGTVGSRIVGGTLNPAGSQLPLNSTEITEGGAVFADGFLYIWLLFPFGLPRWAKYTAPGTSPRQPASPRGMLCQSQTGPADERGVPSSGITLPSAWGFGGGASSAVGKLVAVMTRFGGANYGAISTGGWSAFEFFVPAGAVSTPTITPTILGFEVTMNVTDGVEIPATARRIRVLMTFVGTGVSIAALTGIKSMVSGTYVPFTAGYPTRIGSSGITTTALTGVFELPVVSAYPRSPGLKSRFYKFGIGATTLTSVTAFLYGWSDRP